MPDSLDQSRSEAQALFLDLIEEAPDDPMQALESRAVDDPLRGRVARMIEAYLRTRALERELIATDGEIARAFAEAEQRPRPSVDRAIPERLRGYRVERVIGEGPNSAVLLAHQETPIERTVAIKLLFADASDPRVAARAELERQILASLEHPNIARIYDFGVDERKRPYLVMEYVRGGAVDEWCAGRRLGERDLVGKVFLGIASAVRFAHAHGVLHCDLKCANVLVQVVDGEPHAKVIDFGIARATGGALAERAGLAELPRTIGTLASLSPEALDPAAPAIDVRSDVFGLGLILHELVAGRPARDFSDGDMAAALRALLERPLPRLRSVRADVSVDLDAIVAKATETRPDARYQTVAALVADIEQYLAGREVAARPRRVAERAMRVARKRWRLGLAAAVVGGSTAFVVTLEASRGRARIEAVMGDAASALDSAKAIRNTAGRGAEREAFIARALDGSRAAQLLDPGSAAVMELRAAAVEEAILPRLARGDQKSRETVALVDELVGLREMIAKEEDDSPKALERLSVALAYQYDTTRGTDRQEALETRQVALDEQLHASYPDSLVFADNLCWTYQRVHHDIWMRGDRARSIDYLRKSSALGEQILERHGRTPITLYTATSAALYGSMAAGCTSDFDGVLARAQDARNLGAELLAMSPEHYRGAAFMLRAALTEAVEWVDRGDHQRAQEALVESRALAEPAMLRERGVGFLGFALAESWKQSARLSLQQGDLVGARLALERLVAEMEAERATIEREKLYSAFTTERDAMLARIAAADGRTDDARGLIRSIVASLQRIPASSAELETSIDALVSHCVEMPRGGVAAEFLADIEALLAASEQEPGGVRHIRDSRGWFEWLRRDADSMREAIAAYRRHPSFHAASAYEAFRLERALRKLEAREAPEAADGPTESTESTES